MPDQDPCSTIQPSLSAMLDGELDPARVRAAIAHTDACADCGAFLAWLRVMASVLAPARAGHANLAPVLERAAAAAGDPTASSSSRRWCSR